MPLADLLIRGANASVVVFVVSSTLSVGLGLTVPQIVAPLRNGRLVVLSLVANFVLAPVAAIGLARVLAWMSPWRPDCCWWRLPAAPRFPQAGRSGQGRHAFRGRPDGRADGHHGWLYADRPPA